VDDLTDIPDRPLVPLWDKILQHLEARMAHPVSPGEIFQIDMSFIAEQDIPVSVVLFGDGEDGAVVMVPWRMGRAWTDRETIHLIYVADSVEVRKEVSDE